MLSEAKLKGLASKIVEAPLINFYLGDEYEANPEYRFDLLCLNDILRLRKSRSGHSEILFDLKMEDMESAENGMLSNKDGLIRLTIQGSDTRLGKKISSHFREWRLGESFCFVRRMFKRQKCGVFH